MTSLSTSRKSGDSGHEMKTILRRNEMMSLINLLVDKPHVSIIGIGWQTMDSINRLTKGYVLIV